MCRTSILTCHVVMISNLFETWFVRIKCFLTEITDGLCIKVYLILLRHDHPLIVVEDGEAALLKFQKSVKKAPRAALPIILFVFELDPRDSR